MTAMTPKGTIGGAAKDEKLPVDSSFTCCNIWHENSNSSVLSNAHQQYLIERWAPCAFELTEMLENENTTRQEEIHCDLRQPPHQPVCILEQPEIQASHRVQSFASVTCLKPFATSPPLFPPTLPDAASCNQQVNGEDKLAKSHRVSNTTDLPPPLQLPRRNDRFHAILHHLKEHQHAPVAARRLVADQCGVGCGTQLAHRASFQSPVLGTPLLDAVTASNLAQRRPNTSFQLEHEEKPVWRNATSRTTTKDDGTCTRHREVLPRPPRTSRGIRWCRASAIPHSCDNSANRTLKKIRHVDGSVAKYPTQNATASRIRQKTSPCAEKKRGANIKREATQPMLIPEQKSCSTENREHAPISKQHYSRDKQKHPAVPRPLTAYNFFFLDERDHLLQENEKYSRPSSYYSSERQSAILNALWNRDRTTKRIHRKTHGKFDFITLSKIISQRWKDLPQEIRQFYLDLACKDNLRYKTAMSKKRGNYE